MKLKSALFGTLSFALAASAFAQKAVEAPGGKHAKEAEQMSRTSFRADNPKYWMTRLEQDETMKTCQQYRDNPPRAIGQKLEKLNAATIRYPVDGKLIGDWKEGEKLAAVGTGGHIGFIQPDPAGRVRGGNCYACHELAKKEVAYGTIGPSLRHFGKIRGNSDEIIKYAYDKIYNSNAFTACTNMPRFGLHNWLTPEQITHIVAFLIDPESPVNKD
ncbi:MAG: sulfur oxidation c-type cytochrome SoxX [Dechloromonas sp.]|nr:sulfur oxidation c-type cytochrome SoxX [Dechloromonas sp.]